MQEFQGRRTILKNYAELDILRGMKYSLQLISVEGNQKVKISCHGTRVIPGLKVIYMSFKEYMSTVGFFFQLVG